MCDVSKLSQSIQIFAANLEQHKTLPFALSVAKQKVWTIMLSSTVCDGNKRFISPLDTTCRAQKHSPGHVMLQPQQSSAHSRTAQGAYTPDCGVDDFAVCSVCQSESPMPKMLARLMQILQK